MDNVRSGYICIALPAERLEELEIPMMVDQNEDPHRTAYTVTVDYKFGAYTCLFTAYSQLVLREFMQALQLVYQHTTVH